MKMGKSTISCTMVELKKGPLIYTTQMFSRLFILVTLASRPYKPIMFQHAFLGNFRIFLDKTQKKRWSYDKHQCPRKTQIQMSPNLIPSLVVFAF